jgi:hypothetical protein
MLSVFMLSVFILSVFMLSVFMLSVFMLSVYMLSVFMLSVMAPQRPHTKMVEQEKLNKDLFSFFPFFKSARFIPCQK